MAMAAGSGRMLSFPNCRVSGRMAGRHLGNATLATIMVALALAPWAASAQDYPSKPIRLIVPYLAGGAADVVGRNFADAMASALGQQFIVENRTGGGGLPAAEAVARSAPDGYTLVVSGIASHVLAIAVAKAPPFDPVRDATHIAYFAGSPNVFLAHPSAGIRTFAEFLAAGRASKDGLQYVSPGQGSGGHVVAEYLAGKSGMKLTHVAYRGGGGAIIDLIAGHVKFGSLTLLTGLEHIKAGSLVALGVTTETRFKELPDLPTLKEMGFPDMNATTWYGISGPARLPKDVVDKLSKAAVAAHDKPELKQALERQLLVAERMTPEQYSAYVAAEIAKWGPVVKGLSKPE